MPDALQQAAQQLAPPPARTNFFDPAAGQTVISRYANVKRAGEGLEALGKATTGLADAQLRMEDQQLQREAAMRNKTIFDRESQTYQEQQDFKTERGNFLSQIGGLDPMSPDFQASVAELISGVPEVAMRDDAVQAILAAKNRAWESAQREKEREDYRRQVLEERNRDSEQRQAVRLASLGLKPEEFVFDPSGELDVVMSTAKAIEKRGSVKSAEERAKDAAEEAKNTPEKLKAAAEPLLTDTTAFPTGEMNLARVKASTAKDASQEAVAQARAWDKNREVAELEAAKGYETANEYANLLDKYLADSKLPALTSQQKEKRRALWRVANGGGDAPTAPTASTAQTKQLDEAGARELLKQAKGDKELARKLARDAGYSF
jgi:hypothetical protein